MDKKQCNKCGRPIQYATEPKCNYCDACMSEYCGCKLGRIKEIEPTCDSTAVIPSITVESVEGITNLANCLVHVNDINTTFYVDDKHRVMITWAGPANIPGYDMENNPNGYRDQIVTDIEKGIAVIYDKKGKGFTFGIYQSLDADGSVTQAVNDKLDEMAANGTLEEIISDYIGEPIFGFDTVADMKASTTLQAGDRARTLGFYSVNDGGGALYKITDTGTANEMNVIAIGNLYANLITLDADVLKFGAHGDNSTDDSAVISAAYDYAMTNKTVLRFPKKVYKTNSALNLKSCVIRCDGTINNSSTVTLGAKSNGSTKTDVYIYKINDVQIEGAKVCNFEICVAGNITLYADGNASDNTSIAYNKISGLECSSITLTGVNNGWINENKFDIKRCLGNLTIGGDGTYSHNNNRFDDICIEGSSKNITINYGSYNCITYRGENSPVVSLSSNPAECYGNTVRRQVSGGPGNYLSINDFNTNTTLNFKGSQYTPNMRCTRIYDLNLQNVKKVNGQIWLNDNGEIVPGWQIEYLSEKLEATYPFTVYLSSDVAAHRVIFTCYDENGNKIPGNVYMPGVTYNTTSQDYHLSSNSKSCMVSFAPSNEVKFVELKVTGGGSAKFKEMSIDMYMPFTNTKTFINTIRTDGKRLPNIPSSYTANNPTWAVGDIIYKETPTPGGAVGWICTTAGTGASSVWKEFGAIAA